MYFATRKSTRVRGTRIIGSGFQQLQERIPTAVDLTNGVLTIEGTHGRDVVDVSHRAGILHVQMNNQHSQFSAANVRLIRAVLRHGNDTFDGTGVPRAMIVWGGYGNDRITTGTRPSVLRGNAGNDVLQSGPVRGEGPNRLFGNAGNDVLRGSSGHDVLLGHTGADRLVGRGNTDWYDPGIDNAVDRIFARDGEVLDRIITRGPEDVLVNDVGRYPGGIRDSDFSGQTVGNGRHVDMKLLLGDRDTGTIIYSFHSVSDTGEHFTEDRRANGPIYIFSPNPVDIDPELEDLLRTYRWYATGIFG